MRYSWPRRPCVCLVFLEPQIANTTRWRGNTVAQGNVARRDTTTTKPSLQPESDSPETAAWFNTLLHSLWPIVNPSLFISVADMLEDALQVRYMSSEIADFL